MHIRNGVIVGPADQQYFLVDPHSDLSTVLENHVLDKDVLQEVTARYWTLNFLRSVIDHESEQPHWWSVMEKYWSKRIS